MRCPLTFNCCVWRFEGISFADSITKVDNECVGKVEDNAEKWTCVCADDFYVALKLTPVPYQDNKDTLKLPRNHSDTELKKILINTEGAFCSYFIL